jgi:hypothetical protein
LKWVEASNAEIQSTKREQAIQGIASLHRGGAVIRRRKAAAIVQANARATRLEQSRTKPPAVNARKPSETRSWLRMGHLPLSSLMRDRIYQNCPNVPS